MSVSPGAPGTAQGQQHEGLGDAGGGTATDAPGRPDGARCRAQRVLVSRHR